MGLLAIAAVFGTMAWRGFRAAAEAQATITASSSATALTLFLVVPVLVMAAGILGAMPLTGVVTPFLSYGGSAMAANFAALACWRACVARPAGAPAASIRLEGAVPPARGVARRHAGAARAWRSCSILAAVQAVRADDYAVRPHLGRQADGVRRYPIQPARPERAAAICRAARSTTAPACRWPRSDARVAQRGGRRLRQGRHRRAAHVPGSVVALLSPRRRDVPPARRCVDAVSTGAPRTRRISSATKKRRCGASTTTPPP